MKKLGFVIPWYGEDNPGGAEMLLRGLTSHLHAAGIELEILATCVKEFASDWNVNYYKPGVTTNSLGITVRRFEVRKRDTAAFDSVNRKFIECIPVTKEEEEIFLREMVNSPKLYDYIEKHKDEYHCFIYTPYMFGTTYYGAKTCPEKTVLIPCFHNEGYFYMESYRDVFEKVAGMIFNAYPEEALARENMDLYKVKLATLGTGVEIDISGDEDRFRSKYNIEGPYVIYAGRKDKGKNVHTLIEFHSEYIDRKRKAGSSYTPKLILIGGGQIDIPEEFKDDIIDLGFVSIQDKYDAMKGAVCLCQPSNNESFSIVIMESWLMGRPVIVSENCDVTCDFAKRTRGGLYMKSFWDYEGIMDFYKDNEEIAAKMGANGGKFVRENFDWDIVVRRTIEFLENLYE